MLGTKQHVPNLQLKVNFATTEPGVLRLFVDAESNYQFWMDTNAPKKIKNPTFYRQKFNYIHENPDRKAYVSRAEHWLWSSANPDSPLLTKLFAP